MHPAVSHVLKAVLIALVGAVSQIIVRQLDRYGEPQRHYHQQEEWED